MMRPAQKPPTIFLGAITALVAVMFAVTVWSLFRVPNLAPPVPADGGGDITALAVERWHALWKRLQHGRTALPDPEQLTSEPLDTALRPAGDTAFMRYRNLWSSPPAAIRRRFQVAAMAGTPRQKLAVLAPLTQERDTLVRFRAWLEMARTHLRSRAFDEAIRTAHEALAVPSIEPRIAADAYFIIGIAALERQRWQRAETALARAVRHDPGFWDARWAHLSVLSHLLAERQQRTAACLDHTRVVIEHLGTMPLLAQDRTQFRDLADTLGRYTVRPNPAFHLVTGLGYLWSGDPKRARAALAAASRSQGTLPHQCERLVFERIEALLARLPRPQEG